MSSAYWSGLQIVFDDSEALEANVEASEQVEALDQPADDGSEGP